MVKKLFIFLTLIYLLNCTYPIYKKIKNGGSNYGHEYCDSFNSFRTD